MVQLVHWIIQMKNVKYWRKSLSVHHIKILTNYRSVDWRCQTCNVCMKEVLLPLTTAGDNNEASEAKELAKQIEFKVS